MAEVSVPQSAANAAPGSALYELAVLVNAQAAAINALLAKLDLDAGVTDADYASEIGTMDTLTFSGTAPS